MRALLLALLLAGSCAPSYPYCHTRPVLPFAVQLAGQGKTSWNFADDPYGSVLDVINPAPFAQRVEVHCDPTSESPPYVESEETVCLPPHGTYSRLIELMRADAWRSDVCEPERWWRVQRCE